MKLCCRCYKDRDTTCFYPHKYTADKLDSWCKDCHKIARKERMKYYWKRKEELDKIWILNNRDRYDKYKQNYMKRYNKLYRENNRGKHNASRALRKLDIIKRTPKWLSKSQLDEIKQFYIDAEYLSRYTGVKFHVDHIVPIKGDNVSGLHVPWNLQLLTAKENMSKNNKFAEKKE